MVESKWQWLHYDQSKDMAFCHTCIMAKKIMSLGTGDLAFVSRGYSNWKDAMGEKGAFSTHQIMPEILLERVCFFK